MADDAIYLSPHRTIAGIEMPRVDIVPALANLQDIALNDAERAVVSLLTLAMEHHDPQSKGEIANLGQRLVRVADSLRDAGARLMLLANDDIWDDFIVPEKLADILHACPRTMRDTLAAVVDYNYSDELHDALNGAREGNDVSEGHIVYALMALADFLGRDTASDRAELSKAIDDYNADDGEEEGEE